MAFRTNGTPNGTLWAFGKNRRVNLGRVAVFAVFAAFVQSAFAGTYGGGSGEPNDPYLIYTPQQLNEIGATPADWAKCFKLMADPNLSCYTGTQFNRIGSSGSFTGTFDGNNHTVSNFTYTSSTTDYVGLFGALGSGGQIKNLGLTNVNVTGYNYTGGLVGRNYKGTVTNCYATGTVTGYFCTGGLVGENYWGTITNSYATGNVTGHYDYTGGLVGENDSSSTITKCYATGNVTGSDYHTGGLVGENDGSSTITKCYATGSVTGYDCTGGLVGYNDGTITNSYATGSVTGSGDCTGGLVGENIDTINNCYAAGDVTGQWDYTGGLAGYNWYGTITNSYATGSVTGGSYTGGLVGYRDAGSVTASFWDIETTGQSTSAGGIGKTTAEMKTKSTFTTAGWDFVGEVTNGTKDIWRMCVDGASYPLLWCQFPAGDFDCPDGVDLEDLAFFVPYWLKTNCAAAGDCRHTDINISGTVDITDLSLFAMHWLEEP
jgi:hypothetical protein